MIPVLLVSWVLLSPVLAWLVGSGIRLRNAGGPPARSLPARLDPRAELPRLDRSLLVLGVLAAVVLAFATRGQLVTWHGVIEARP